LAALATVGAAQAQSSVTVYGTYDMGYQAISYDNLSGSRDAANQDKAAGIAGSALTSNRFGLRGSEDLGGGLKANFNLEYGFFNQLVGDTVTTATNTTGNTASVTAPTVAAANGGGDIQTRTSRLGLESNKLGRLDVGYGLTGLFATVTGHSPLPGNNFIGDVAYTSNSIASNASSRILAGAVRASGVQYTSPSVNGIQAVVDYGSGYYRNGDATAVADSRTSNAGLTLRYTQGPLSLAATTHQLKADASATANEITTTSFEAYSARYAVSSKLAVNALYAKNKATKLNDAQSAKNDVTQVGATYSMGKTSLVAQYGTGNGETTVGTSMVDRKGYQLGAIYTLSKRTNVYGIYGSQEAKFVNSSNANEKVSGYTVGLRHSF